MLVFSTVLYVLDSTPDCVAIFPSESDCATKMEKNLRVRC